MSVLSIRYLAGPDGEDEQCIGTRSDLDQRRPQRVRSALLEARRRPLRAARSAPPFTGACLPRTIGCPHLILSIFLSVGFLWQRQKLRDASDDLGGTLETTTACSVVRDPPGLRRAMRSKFKTVVVSSGPRPRSSLASSNLCRRQRKIRTSDGAPPQGHQEVLARAVQLYSSTRRAQPRSSTSPPTCAGRTRVALILLHLVIMTK